MKHTLIVYVPMSVNESLDTHSHSVIIHYQATHTLSLSIYIYECQ